MKGRKTGGRKKGTPNKRTAALAKEAEAFGLSPRQVLLKYMNDPSQPDAVILDCAKALMPYTEARRAAEDRHGNVPQERIIETLPGILRQRPKDEPEDAAEPDEEPTIQ